MEAGGKITAPSGKHRDRSVAIIQSRVKKLYRSGDSVFLFFSFFFHFLHHTINKISGISSLQLPVSHFTLMFLAASLFT